MFRSVASGGRRLLLIGLAVGLLLGGGGWALMGAFSPSPAFECIEFKHAPTQQPLPSCSNVLGLTICYLGGPGDMAIYDMDGDGDNEFFLSSGRINIELPRVTTMLQAISAHFFGSLTVDALNCGGAIVDTTQSHMPNAWQKLWSMAEEICSFEVDGEEVAIDKVCLFMD